MVFVKNFLRGFADKFASKTDDYMNIMRTCSINVEYGLYEGKSKSFIEMRDSRGKELYRFLLKREGEGKVTEEYRYLWDNLISKHTSFMRWLNRHNLEVNKLEDYDVLEKDNLNLELKLNDYEDTCHLFPYFDSLSEVIKY